jgi:hypothetical protein
VKNIKNFNFKQKDAGISFVNSGSTNKMLNIHLDSKKLRQHPEDPIYQLLVRLGRKISFPTKEFLEAWEGDLSFREGGKQINILHVSVDNSSVSMELAYQQELMIERIAIYLGYKGIHKIRLLVRG